MNTAKHEFLITSGAFAVDISMLGIESVDRPKLYIGILVAG